MSTFGPNNRLVKMSYSDSPTTQFKQGQLSEYEM